LNGGAVFGAFYIPVQEVFNWFASRGRLLEFDVLPSLLARREIRESLPALLITEFAKPESPSDDLVGANGFEMKSSFHFDGELAAALYAGGAYGSEADGAGRAEKEEALRFCDAMFGSRFSEIWYYESSTAWTPWFRDEGWDWTAVLFDQRTHNLWLLAITDKD